MGLINAMFILALMCVLILIILAITGFHIDLNDHKKASEYQRGPFDREPNLGE